MEEKAVDAHEELLAKIRALETNLEIEKSNCRQLEADKRELKKACVSLQQHAEQDEEFISNSLMKRIKDLEKEKNRLETLGEDTRALHFQLENLRREKVDLENKLDQESEFVVNRMAKEKEKLIERNHQLEEKLHQRAASPALDSSLHVFRELSQEVLRLRQVLSGGPGKPDSDHVAKLLEEHQLLRDENTRLQRKLQYAMEKIATLEKANMQIRAQAEMDDERHFNIRRSVESSRTASPNPNRALPGSSPASIPHMQHPSSLHGSVSSRSFDRSPSQPTSSASIFTP